NHSNRYYNTMDVDNNNNINNNIYNDGGRSALDLLKEESECNHIISFCLALDTMLRGGIPLKKITEFCGVPGVGKTQMAFQLAVNCAIPIEFDGVAGKCLFIDTEGSFAVSRIRQMATALIEHLHLVAAEATPELQNIANNMTVDQVMDSIFYYRVHHYIEQIALVNMLPSILSNNPDIRLIIIDSITYPFRRVFKDNFLKTRCLSSMAQSLHSVAQQYNVAVVIMNQVTTKVVANSEESLLIPTLGESWSHTCTNRVYLYFKEHQRYCHLYKSPSFQSTNSEFCIGPNGVRGADEEPQPLEDEDDEFEWEEEDFGVGVGAPDSHSPTPPV
ncbi:hypothetical protein SAMD00019534_097260, partial [Acytostelium subglobosum LB1]|uniref:hypothetical protein n=1 Tax=Acytostelium subglobosum LB1 TaxID=1410327 RepID=UPI000644F0D4